MAIQPGYAQAILCGTKNVEFRKRALAPDIDTVLVYETAPTQAIVGAFTVGGMDLASPQILWRRHWRQAGICRAAFDRYYAGTRVAVAIFVASSRRFSQSIGLAQLDPRPAVPQSFSYLSSDSLEEVRQLQSLPTSDAVTTTIETVSSTLDDGLLPMKPGLGVLSGVR